MRSALPTETLHYLGPLFVLLLCFGLICYFDFRWLVIPDIVTGALAVFGLVIKATDGFAALVTSIGSAATVIFLMWLIREIHLRIAGRVGLGLGDVKFAGAAVIWFGPLLFPVFLFLAAAMALLFLAAKAMVGHSGWRDRLPFGPFLAGSLIVTWNIGVFSAYSTGLAS
jgi:prepilin signal peptidase PulO-like enzyme (type II secretory pathway)